MEDRIRESAPAEAEQTPAPKTEVPGAEQGIAPQRLVSTPDQVFDNWSQIVSIYRNEFSRLLEGGVTREQAGEEQYFYDWLLGIQNQQPQIRVINSQLSQLTAFLRAELLGLGVLDLYLADKKIEDIFIDRFDTMDVIREGERIRVTPAPFGSEQEMFTWLQARVFSPINKEFNRSNPAENAILPDGSRLIALTDPISPYTSIAVRRHKQEVFATVEAYMSTGVAPPSFFSDLDSWVKGQRNLIMSGATGSGKTTMVNVAGSLVPYGERVITLEDTPELQIQHPRIKPLYTYEKGARAGSEGEADIPMSDLLRYSLRMKPDRIVVGEVRDRETYDMLDILNTGHAGSFTTLHANSPVDALTRLQMMSSRHPARGNLGTELLQDLIASVIDVLVQIKNFSGQRRVIAVEQVMYGQHYADRPQILTEPGVRQIYPSLFLRPLWRWNHQKGMLERAADFIPPDHG